MPYDPRSHRPLSFHDAVPAFLAGHDTPRDYLERCIATIEARELEVQAWMALNLEGAREAADASTARYRSGSPIGPVDGMPIGVKDILQTHDMPTSLGILGNEDARTRQDSASVWALRAAGAVILGKTVTTELGGAHPSKSRNPFDATRTAGGSSSGSGAAVGAGMVPAALGTQVVGSIIRPAAFSANVAIKPSFGALNRGERQGLSQSCLGVHAGALEDMWHVAAEIAARAGGDTGHPGMGGTLVPPPARRPTRLIVLETEGWAAVEAPSRDAFAEILAQLEAEGITLLRRSDNPLIEAFERAIDGSVRMSTELVAFENKWSQANLLRLFPSRLSDTTLASFARADAMTVTDYRDLLARRAEARLRHTSLAPIADGIITLSCTGPAPVIDEIIHRPVGRTGNTAMNAWTSFLGCPAVTVPLIGVGGMPVGVQVAGLPGQDEATVGLARWLISAAAPVVR
ncbi:amidase family protein [Roseomonas xinghualingensis]|uniref:amidase family protein n=1 Tax=Roseomonas xinghualingensis TaxID=2986475 RepID=UPI0021F211EE|nr:amidase [Roseomonas sp. SXEYE001]MCV4210172.1 amidase [Roseomonas sp. SXEYE001]